VDCATTAGPDNYTPEQMKQFEEAGRRVPPEEVRAAEEAWTALLAEVRENRDLDPASSQAQAPARRWDELGERTCAAIRRSRS
jgi:hypothetical protein